MPGLIRREGEAWSEELEWFGFLSSRSSKSRVPPSTDGAMAHQSAVPQDLSRASGVVGTGPKNKLVAKLPVVLVQGPSRGGSCLHQAEVQTDKQTGPSTDLPAVQVGLKWSPQPNRQQVGVGGSR